MGLKKSKGLINAARDRCRTRERGGCSSGVDPDVPQGPVPEGNRGTGQGWSFPPLLTTSRANSAVTELERDLGRWLSTQRHTFRQGELSPARSEALDAALPGWLEGRKGTAERPPSHNLL